jgi:hypothetical protein
MAEKKAGEGIRALPCPVRSVSYRIQIASIPKFAMNAVDHCTLLHAGRDPIAPFNRSWFGGLGHSAK